MDPSNSSTPNSSTSKQQHRITRTSVMFMVLLVLWLVAFIPVYPRLVWTWLNHSDNSHGLLVPFVSVYFIWQERAKFKEIKISHSNWGIIILIISMGFYLLSYAGGVAVVSRAMIVSSLIGLVLSALGKEVFGLLSFPLLYLFLWCRFLNRSCFWSLFPSSFLRPRFLPLSFKFFLSRLTGKGICSTLRRPISK